jgi:hypothetical protein
MNRFFNILLGVICFALAINGVITGRIGGLGKSGAGGMAIRENNPEYFWITIIVVVIVGTVLLLKARKPGSK